MQLNQVNQNQAIQRAQQSVAPMGFDPDEIMQEISEKYVQLQLKEKELIMREQILAQNEQVAQQQAAEQETAQAQAQEQAVPLAPTKQSTGQLAQQQPQDAESQTIQNLQPGQIVNITKKVEMTPQGPVEIGRGESILQQKKS